MRSNKKLYILLLLWIVAFIPVYTELWEAWLNHSNNSHGLLVPFISVYLIWQKQNQLNKAVVNSSNMGAFILAFSMLLYIISYIGAVAVVSRAMIVTSLIGIILFNYGVAVFSIIQFPLIYLIFMVPVPSTIYGMAALPLQIFATKVSTFIIKILTIPVHREGTMLYFSSTQLEVAEQCSGLRSITSFIMLSLLFAYLMDKNWWKRLFVVMSAIPLAIFVNIARVTGTGILANFYGATVARGFLHEFSGMAVFVFGFILLTIEFILLNRIPNKR